MWMQEKEYEYFEGRLQLHVTLNDCAGHFCWRQSLIVVALAGLEFTL